MLYKKVENNTHVLKVYYDESPMNPREWDNLGTMICWHNKCSLGDNHDYDNPSDMFRGIAEELLLVDSETLDDMTDEEVRRLVLESQEIIILPIYAYEHGGITISTEGFSCPWDSGQVGYIYVTLDLLKKETGYKFKTDDEWRKKGIDILKDEVKMYDYYLTGEVFGFSLEEKVKCKCCGHIDSKQINSCWGFYGIDFSNNGLLDYLGDEYKELAAEL